MIMQIGKRGTVFYRKYSDGEIVSVKYQGYHISFCRLRLRTAIALQHGGRADTSVIDEKMIVDFVMFHARNGTFHGYMGMSGNKNDILVAIEDLLKLIIPAQVRLGITSFGIVCQQWCMAKDNAPPGTAGI